MADLDYFFKKRFNEIGEIEDPFNTKPDGFVKAEVILEPEVKKHRGRPRKLPLKTTGIKKVILEGNDRGKRLNLGIEHDIPIPKKAGGGKISFQRQRAIAMKKGDSVLCKTVNEAKSLRIAITRENKIPVWRKSGNNGHIRIWVIGKKKEKKDEITT